MKKILFALMLLLATSQFAIAQKKDKAPVSTDEPIETVTDSVSDDSSDVAEAPANEYNRWSFELGVGGNKPNQPFTPGYSASNESQFLNVGKLDHYEAGIRYMLNTKFGLKLKGFMDKIENVEGSNSPEFQTELMGGSLEGVINVGRMLNFEEFTSRFGLLLHGGFQVSQFSIKKAFLNEGVKEMNGGLVYGVTPQIRISNRVVLHLDVTFLNNFRQHYSWDGNTNAFDNSNFRDNNLRGEMTTTSAGLTIYLGKHDVHADWYASPAAVVQQAAEPVEVDLSGITARLDELEKCAQDTDKDGVNDCVDQEENSKEGAFVDTKGVTMERPVNGKDGKDGQTQIIKEPLKPTEIHKGSLLNIFYDVNKDTPNAGSIGDVSLIIGYMIANPDSKIRLIGYADTRGGAATNLALSQRRAKNLTASIVAKGINQNRIRFDGFGVDKQKSNMSKEEMDYARRTEVIVE